MSLNRGLLILGVGLLVALDQLTKWIARGPLQEQGPFSYFGDWLRFEYVENSGAFLSLGANWPDFLRKGAFQLGVVLTLGYISWLLYKKHWDARARWGLALVWAGGFGNLIDRVWKDSVTDFVVLGQGWFRTGVFNVADFVIVVGLLFVLFGKERKLEPQAVSA